MKATFMQRFLAYFIDIIILSIVISLFTMSFSNSKLEQINNELSEATTNLINATNGSDATALNELNEKITDLEYRYQKASVLPNSISLVIYIAYFIIFQFFYKGQTIGKKCLKIRVVNKEEKEPSLTTIFLRTFITQGILVTFLSLITIVLLPKDLYLGFYSVINVLSSIFIIVCALMVLYRKDRRGLHDMMAGSFVIKEEN